MGAARAGGAGRAVPDGRRAAGRLEGGAPARQHLLAERSRRAASKPATRFAALAREHGLPPGQLALLWCKDQPGVTSPIVGPRTLEQFVDLLPVLEMSLTDEQRAACDAINPPGTALVNFHNTAAWMKTAI